MIGYPKWFSKNLITASIVVLSLTGVILIPSALLFRLDLNINYVLPGDARILSTAIHVLASYLVFLIVGALLFIHVRLGLKKRKKTKSGISMLIFFLFLSLSGVALFYCANENLIKLSSILHIMLGVFFIAIYFTHLQLKSK